MGKKGSLKGSHPASYSFDASSGLEYPLKWNEERAIFDKGFKNDVVKFNASKGFSSGKRHVRWICRHMRSVIFTFTLIGFFFLLDSLMFSLFDPSFLKSRTAPRISFPPKGIETEHHEQRETLVMYHRLLQMATVSLAERELEQNESKFWKEPYRQASLWKPCADKRSKGRNIKSQNGFILVSANGGLNQQRVAVCNAVAVASLLNATLVIPKFLYSNVWKDPSQFSDIYQEEAFMNILKDDIDIVRELPSHFKSVDLKDIGSLVTDADLAKEATPDEYIQKILPVLLRNGVVHFLGFGNRLGFDPLPFELQKLRCKCNFHALKFVQKIQKTGSLLLKRIRKHDAAKSVLDKQLVGNFFSNVPSKEANTIQSSSKYLALHLRFEADMVAYSLCDFGGGENETRELQAYREEHFPLLLERLKKMKPLSPVELRMMGRCPLMPEEAALVLAGLGFDHLTNIYIAGSQIYGGESRMYPLTRLYPNLVTKEDLLSPDELLPFRNFSSQLAALDFIACAASDVFAMTDSGSQLSSLVSGYRIYYGGGNAPTLRPSKKRLAAILQENSTIRWHSFETRVRKMIQEGQMVRARSYGRSLYRQPRDKGCMCRHS